MDYLGMLKASWWEARRRPLLGLGAVSAVSTAASSLVLTLSIALVVVVFAGTAALSLSTEDPVAQAKIAETIIAVAGSVGQYGPLLWALGLAVGLSVLLLAVADIAAQGGLILQADAQLRGEPVSFVTGMRQGMARWWRVAGLVAIAMLPGLLVALGYSMVLFNFTRTADSPDAVLGGAVYLQMLSPLANIVSLLSIPLGVLVWLSLRFALIADLEWRAALAAAWHHLVTHFVEVLLVYLMMMLIGWLVGIVLGVGIAVVVIVIAVLIAISAAGGLTATLVIGAGLGVLAVAAVIFVAQWIFMLLSSVLWTVYWRAATGRDDRWVKTTESVSAFEPVEGDA